MAKVAPIQNSFNGGELDPLVAARVDFNKRESSVALLQGYVPTIQGPAIRCPGTYHVAGVKNSAKAVRLIPFEFSTEQAYILEFGDAYIRFYRDQGQIESGGSPYEIASPYLEADLADIQFTQSADVLFIVHPDYATRELTRTGHTSWTLTSTTFRDGPYLPLNTTSTTLIASAATGSVTVTASSVTGINNNTGFQTTDVGRIMRILSGGFWAWGTITARSSTTQVTVTVESGSFPTGSGVATWRLGFWSATTGYPSTIAFYSDRLFFGGAAANSQRVDGSRTGDYDNFAPSDTDGTVVDDHAISVTVNSNKVNNATWMLDQDKGLILGTTGGEFVIRASAQNEALSPSNAKPDRTSPHGSARIMPVRVGPSLLYSQRAKRKLREMLYSLEADGYKSFDSSKLAHHILKSGIKELAYQQEPHSVVWCARNDGVLVGITYDKDEDVFAWFRRVMGGVSDANGSPAKVESIAVIPAPDGSYDELWLSVQRYVNGAVVRYVEYMVAYWGHDNVLEDAFFVDSGLTYSGAATSTLTGLNHLEGQTVTILANGALHPDKTVTAGQITLDYDVTKAHVGIRYESSIQSLSIEAGSEDGTPVGKTKRIHRLLIKVLNTLGLKYGPNANKLKEHVFRKASDPMGAPPPLFSGDISVTWEGDYQTQAQVYLRQDGPFPGTIAAMVPLMHTVDR